MLYYHTPSRPLALGLCLAASTALSVSAEPLRVVTDIQPVQSLVAQVLGDAGSASVLVRAGQSPHGAALRPSDAQNISKADLVVWIGPDLTPWLADAIPTLAQDTPSLVLLESPGTDLLEARSKHDHGDGEGHEEGHDDHDDHEAHDHAEADHDGDAHKDGHDDHGDHEDGHDHDEGHEHFGTDPHAWLNPHNGALWLDAIAEALAAADPANAAQYRANAEAGRAKIAAVEADVASDLAGLGDRPYLVFHDAYQYFEHSFDLHEAVHVSAGDGTKPSAGQVARLVASIEAESIACAFTEPQFNDTLLLRLFEDRAVTIAELDPLGQELPAGPDLYPGLIAQLGARFASCLTTP